MVDLAQYKVQMLRSFSATNVLLYYRLIYAVALILPCPWTTLFVHVTSNWANE